MPDLAARAIDYSRHKLPLLITGADWDGTNLGIWGVDWSFNTMSAFRLLPGDQRACGCYDTNVAQAVKRLVNHQIISIEKLLANGQDFNFITDDSTSIQVFLTISVEPWVFHFSNEITFVGSSIVEESDKQSTSI